MFAGEESDFLAASRKVPKWSAGAERPKSGTASGWLSRKTA